MANRFGRNQRRRMREQVAALEGNLSNMQQAYEMANGLQQRTSRDLEKAKYQLKVCEEVLGKHFVAFDRKTMRVDYFAETLRLAMPDYSVIQLKPVELYFRQDVVDLGYHVTLYVPNGGSKIYLSMQALLSMSRKHAEDYLINAVAKDLVTHVLDAIRGGV